MVNCWVDTGPFRSEFGSRARDYSDPCCDYFPTNENFVVKAESLQNLFQLKHIRTVVVFFKQKLSVFRLKDGNKV